MVSRYTTPSVGTVDGLYVANSTTGLPIGDSAAKDLLYSSFGFVVAASPTTVVEILGIANKKYRVKKIYFDGTVASSLGFDFSLNARSTASTGGSSTNQDSLSYVTHAVTVGLAIKAFTANPTAGTLVGRLRRNSFSILTTASTTYRNPDSAAWDFGDNGPVLDSATDILTIDMSAPATSPTRLDITIEYVEEPTQ